MKKAVMNYTNYDMWVIQKFQVKLIGWTYNKFISPFEIHTIDDVRTLVQALRCGRCHWVRMTATEVTKHAGDMEAKKASTFQSPPNSCRTGRSPAGVLQES